MSFVFTPITCVSIASNAVRTLSSQSLHVQLIPYRMVKLPLPKTERAPFPHLLTLHLTSVKVTANSEGLQ